MKNVKLGQILMTPGVAERVPASAIQAALLRHKSGDWGEVDDEDKATNDNALSTGERLLSAYDHDLVKFWIITERDRSVTTVLLPDEY